MPAWLVVAAALTAVGLCSSCLSSEPAATATTSGAASDGPLANTEPHGWAVGAQTGVAFTDGLEVLRLEGDQPATIDAVRINGDPGLELVGVKLVGPGRSLGAIQYSDAWPPTNDPDLRHEQLLPTSTPVTPLSEDKSGWELLLGLRADEPGRYERDSVTIDYTVAGKKYTLVRPAKLVVCAADDAAPKRCDGSR